MTKNDDSPISFGFISHLSPYLGCHNPKRAAIISYSANFYSIILFAADFDS